MKPYFILTILVSLAYANSLQNQFVWDDMVLIVNNPNINLPLMEIPMVFKTSLWEMLRFDGQQVYYRPMVSLLYVLNYKIWGLNPAGFHFANIFLHLVIVIIIYKIGLLLFNNDALISLIGASIFAVHPVNNEPIGRAASGEVIFGFFIILSIYLFLKESKYLSFLTFFLALLSKEASVMLPFALAILSMHKKGIKNGIIAIIPYIILVGIYLIIRTLVVDIVLGEDMQQAILTQIITMAVAALDYIRLLLLPYPLSPYYPVRWHASIFEPKVMLAIIVLTAISFLAYKIRKDKTMLFCLTFPFIMLAPVIWRVNRFYVGDDLIFIAERFLYVPLMLFSILMSALTLKIAGEKKRYISAVWVLVITAFSAATIYGNITWKDNLTLFKKIISAAPNASSGYNDLGLAYANQGQFNEAIKEYKTALSIKPDHAIHNNLGNAYYKQGRMEEAIAEYLSALRVKPNFADARNNLGLVYFDKGQIDDAVKEYLTALKINPSLAKAHYNLGRAYFDKGQIDEAIKEFLTALKLKPDYIGAHNELGIAYANKGMLDEAVNELLTALKIKQDYTDAKYNLGLVYLKKGLKYKAVEEFKTALKIKPDFAAAQKALEILDSKP